jgi:hypothetical protein
MDGLTKVGRLQVPVRRASHPTLWYFASGEHGRKEAGVYAFWTAVISRRKPKGLIGRALAAEPPGDRFDRIRREMRTARSKADRAAYARHWRELLARGKAIRYVRPSTEREVRKWMKGHEKDARHAKRIRVPR